MAIDTTTLTPASIKAKNVATEEYVDNSLASIPDPTWDSLGDKDYFAGLLGFPNYQTMVDNYVAENTIINGGFINTGLLQAESIAANKINTNGLIAENISGKTISGKTIVGGSIEGARVSGAVISASYIDLDGDLEILTDYHLYPDQAALDAGIAAGKVGRLVLESDKIENGGDAVYTSADNEWRIPTLSLIEEPVGSIEHQYNTTRETQYGTVYISWSDPGATYSTYTRTLSNTTAGHTSKFRKLQPKLDARNLTVQKLCTIHTNHFDCTHYTQYNAWGRANFYFNGVFVAEIYCREIPNSSADCGSMEYAITGPYVNASGSLNNCSTGSASGAFSVFGVGFTWGASIASHNSGAHMAIALDMELHTPTADLANEDYLFKSEIVSYGGGVADFNAGFSFNNPAGMLVNNMI